MHTTLPVWRLCSISIAAVERDTGLSKDTLRVWERRYGFPRPERDAGATAVIRRTRSSACAPSAA